MEKTIEIKRRPLGTTGLSVSPIGYGAFKIGRNENTKYPRAYDLPAEARVDALLNALLDLGVNYVDTAPAYGLSEARIGRAIGHRRREFVLSTKVGERFESGVSTYDFSRAAVRSSIQTSLDRLCTDWLDVVYVHSDGNDLGIQAGTDVIPALTELKAAGTIRAIGFSGKTVEGTRQALAWSDVVMVEYHQNDRSHAEVIAEAGERGVGVVVKKGLASGHLAAADAIAFVLSNPRVASLVIGGLNIDHIRANLASLGGPDPAA